MAHLAIDALGAKHGGAAVVALHVVQAALRHPDVNKVTLFGSLERIRRFSWPADPRLSVIEPGYPDESAAGRVAWSLFGLKRRARDLGVDRLLCLSNAGVGPRAVPTTVMVHQPLPYSPEGMACYGTAIKLRVAAVQALTTASIRRARAVIVQTPTMRAWVGRDPHLAPNKIHVVPPDPGPAEAEARSAREPFQILYVGSNALYKNLECLASAVNAVSEHHPRARVACTLAPEDPLLRDPRWSALGYIGPEELAQRYRQASVLVMPSLVETVGLPLLEAMRYGLPVIAADRPYAHDICADGALFFEPTRPESLARALERVWNEPAATAERVNKGRARVNALHAKRGYDVLVSVALSA